MVEPGGKQLDYCYLGSYCRPGFWKCHLVSEPFAGQSLLSPSMLYTSTSDFCLCSMCYIFKYFITLLVCSPAPPVSRALCVLFCTDLLALGQGSQPSCRTNELVNVVSTLMLPQKGRCSHCCLTEERTDGLKGLSQSLILRQPTAQCHLGAPWTCRLSRGRA